MVQQEILEIFGIPLQVELTFASKTARRVHICFGMITYRVNPRTSLKTIKQNLERMLDKEKIKKLNPEPLLSEEYGYVFGEITKIYKKSNKDLSPSNCYVIMNGKKVTLTKLLKEYIEFKCGEYEKMMGLSKHEIKIKKLTAVLGNNHITRRVLNFNEKLVHFSMELIDSVIVHELCHDIEANHSNKFYRYVEMYCPNYQQKRNKLICGVRK